MPEPGFAQALDYQISGDAAAGRQAVAWALGPGDDLRQLALVFDWCQDLLSEAQRRALAARIQKGMAAAAADDGIAAVRSRVLAAVALFDEVPQAPQRELERVVRSWWDGKMAPALENGRGVVARDDAYPLFELLHAMRDNTTLDLREALPGLLQGLSHRAPGEPLPGGLRSAGERVPHRAAAQAGPAGSAAGRALARGGAGHGGL